MKDRIEKLKNRIFPEKIPFCVAKAQLFTDEYIRSNNEPEMIRTAKAQANVLDHIPIFIIEGELIVGNPASKEMGIEADFWNKGVWTDEGIESLREEGGYGISEETAAEMKRMSSYWRKIITDYKVLNLYDEEMWSWKKSGFLLPPSISYEQAAGNGFAGNGFSICGDAADINSLDYGYILEKGLNAYIKEAEAELASMTPERLCSEEDYKKVEFLRAAIIIQKAFVRFGERFSKLAEKMAQQCENDVQKQELERIAETCAWVPANKPRTFQEAVQFVWFLFLMCVNRNTTPLGRFDQYMYPYYQEDLKEGRITEEETIELLECLRIKFMQLKSTSGGATRKKWSGHAKWNNMTIGGVLGNGEDATNPLTYLILEAAYRCRVPHHTITLRIHEGTPRELLLAAVRLVKTGIGMPAFVGDNSYIASMVEHEVPLEKARQYYMIGCIDPTVPEGFGNVFSMIVPPLAFDTYLHNGYSKVLGYQVAPINTPVEAAKTFDEFVDGFIEHLKYYLHYHAKDNAMRYFIGRDILPDVFTLSLWSDGIRVGKIGRYRELPYKLGPTMNVGVGAINIADSLYSIKKLVYDSSENLSLKELIEALDDNWQSVKSQEIRRRCMSLPKYGNNEKEVDCVAAMIYHRMTKAVSEIISYRGIPYNSGAISITAYEPGGALVGATPDGRYAKEALADACLSPAQGKDESGPVSVLNSALAVDQNQVMSMLMNMKIHPTALTKEEDMEKLGMLIKIYLVNGGKHIQFNVVDKETLEAAQKNPENYRDLVVRVAGYSAYFVQLSRGVQEDLLTRTEHYV